MSFFPLIALLMTTVLFLHAVFARAPEAEAVPRDQPPAKPLPDTNLQRSAITLPRIGLILLAALGFWLSLSMVVPMLAWLFWIGDNEHWFWHVWPVVTAALAILATAPLVYRTLATPLGSHFFSVQTFFAAAVCGLWGAFWLASLLEPIQGLSPLAAVHTVVRNYGRDPNDFSYVETDESEPLFPKDPANYRTFLVMDEDEIRARITVHRHLGSTWKQVGVSWYPNAAAAREGQQMLEELNARIGGQKSRGEL